MSFELRLSGRAEAYLARLDPPTRERIRRRLNEIATAPYGQHTKWLTGRRGLRASRVGDYRILFEVDDAAREIAVTIIGPRGQVYRRL